MVGPVARMSEVRLYQKVLTRKALVEALIREHGDEQAMTMLRGKTAPEFDEARDLPHPFARRVFHWCTDRMIPVELKYRRVKQRPRFEETP